MFILDEESDIEIYGGDKVSKDELIDVLQNFNILNNLVQDECKNDYEKSFRYCKLSVCTIMD